MDHWCFCDRQQYVFDKLKVKFSNSNSENKYATELSTPMDNMSVVMPYEPLRVTLQKSFGLVTGIIIILRITYPGAHVTNRCNQRHASLQ